MKKGIAAFVLAFALMSPTATFAASVCMKDGKEVGNANDKKTCKAQGGTWTKKKAEKTPKKGS